MVSGKYKLVLNNETSNQPRGPGLLYDMKGNMNGNIIGYGPLSGLVEVCLRTKRLLGPAERHLPVWRNFENVCTLNNLSFV